MTKADIVRQVSENTGIDKVARNISKQTTIVIPAHSIPSFKPAKIFRESIKN